MGLIEVESPTLNVVSTILLPRILDRIQGENEKASALISLLPLLL